MEKTDQINEKFREEYGSEDAVRKYSTGTASFGVHYLLHNDYARVYLSAVDSYLHLTATPSSSAGVRLWHRDEGTSELRGNTNLHQKAATCRA